MRRYFCPLTLLLALALALAPQGFADQPVLPDRFGAWTGTQTSLSGPPGDSASTVDPQRSALFQETGAQREEYRTYSSNNKQISVFVTRFRDSSGAYEFYTHGLQVGMKPWEAGQVAAINNDSLTILLGSLVVVVNNQRQISSADVRQLLAALPANKVPLPPIRGFLPEADLVNGTQRYALGTAGFRAAAADLGRPEFAELADSLGFPKGAEAMFARYKPGALLILIDYPTPQLAELHLRHLQVSLPDAAKESGATIERKGSLLSIISAPARPSYAQTLRSAINYETQVTWNEPSQTATDPPWSVVLYRIFLGTAVFMVMAIIGGIMYGGLRIATKRLWPGKVFDRPKNIEVLQLGLSGKRIDPSDFY